MEKMTSITEWEIHPKSAKVLLLLCITSGLVGVFSQELSLNSFGKHVAFTISTVCLCSFVLPNLQIWQKTGAKKNVH